MNNKLEQNGNTNKNDLTEKSLKNFINTNE